MAGLDTTMGGSQSRFPETAWSSILSAKDPSSPARRAKLDDLISRYWRPVYRFLRHTSWGRSAEDAKDLTQAFFTHLVESDLVTRYEPDKGRFRRFLKGALRIFLAEEHRDRNRLKRNSGGPVLPLDLTDAEKSAPAADGGLSPEDLFDRQWARDVVAQAVERLRVLLAKEGKEAYFKVYEAYELRPAEGASYATVAAAFGLSTSDVQNYLGVARERLQQLIVACVADYVSSPDDVADEINDLFRS